MGKYRTIIHKMKLLVGKYEKSPNYSFSGWFHGKAICLLSGGFSSAMFSIGMGSQQWWTGAAATAPFFAQKKWLESHRNQTAYPFQSDEFTTRRWQKQYIDMGYHKEVPVLSGMHIQIMY